MMKTEINVKWLQNMQFQADVNNHKILLDTAAEFGGEDSGPRPKPLMLVSLAGCTGMDVISILKKMKINLEHFNVKVEGISTDEHPKRYYKMKIYYEFKGVNLIKDKLKKAIELSLNKYCGVNAVYKDVIDVKYEIKIL